MVDKIRGAVGGISKEGSCFSVDNRLAVIAFVFTNAQNVL